MNREEILSKSRTDNKMYDERERNVYTKSSAIAKGVGNSLGVIIALVEIFFFDHPPVASMAAFSVCYTMDAVESWCRFFSLKSKLYLVGSILLSVFAVAFMITLTVLLCKG